MLQTNEQNLVEMSVQGQPMYPKFFGWEATHQGQNLFLPSVGGIVYNVKVGDSVYDLVGDHIEPCVTATASRDKPKDNPNRSFNAYACIGNQARLVSGDAKGATGIVTGHHGGVEHVMVDFADDTLDQLTHDDKFIIRCYGMGLALTNYPEISLYGLAPTLLHKMNIEKTNKGLCVPVTATIPAVLMGSGLGSYSPFTGDYDMQTSDKQTLKEHQLENLKLGDIVAIDDYQTHYGYSYSKNAISIGVVVHADSVLAGHGPGIQIVMTASSKELLATQLAKEANIGNYLGIGRWR